jgi:hypothetical protein
MTTILSWGLACPKEEAVGDNLESCHGSSQANVLLNISKTEQNSREEPPLLAYLKEPLQPESEQICGRGTNRYQKLMQIHGHKISTG